MLKLSVIVFFALRTAQLAKCSEELYSFAKISKECYDENNLTEQEFKDFYMNDMKPEAATQNIKCHLKCIMEKMKHLKSGILDVDAAVKTWSTITELKNNIESVKQAYEICKNENGIDDCDTAYKISMCLDKNDYGSDLKV